MTSDTPQPVASTSNDAPAFPHHAAVAQTPLEAAERQYADQPAGAPRWQPDEGDFN